MRPSIEFGSLKSRDTFAYGEGRKEGSLNEGETDGARRRRLALRPSVHPPASSRRGDRAAPVLLPRIRRRRERGRRRRHRPSEAPCACVRAYRVSTAVGQFDVQCVELAPMFHPRWCPRRRGRGRRGAVPRNLAPILRVPLLCMQGGPARVATGERASGRKPHAAAAADARFRAGQRRAK